MKKTATSQDQRVLFFRSQRDVLQRTAKTQEEEFTISGKQKIRNSQNPLQQALTLHEALKENYTSAYAKQQTESLDAWCVYQAKAALNDKSQGSDKGTDLKNQIGDTSEAGVLGIVIRVEKPGQKPRIERAEIEGLNQGLRALIENRPLGAIKVPMTIKGEVFDDIGFARKYLSHEDQPTIAVGRNEQGTIWVDKSRYNGLYWLQKRAVPNPQQAWDGQGRIHDSFPDGAEFRGAQLLIEEDMKDLTVSGKLSG